MHARTSGVKFLKLKSPGIFESSCSVTRMMVRYHVCTIIRRYAVTCSKCQNENSSTESRFLLALMRGTHIFKASASMMTQAVKGKTKKESEVLFDEFHRMVTDQLDEESEPNQLGKLKIFAGVREYPVRVKCATLSWHTLQAEL